MRTIENKLYISALERGLSNLDLSPLQGKTVLITGATGMLGSCVVDLLRLNGRCRVIAAGRDIETAEKRFGPNNETYSFLQQDVSAPITGIWEDVDYIIHAASNADPVRMAGDPVGTLVANVQGTKNLLDYGISHNMKRFLFVSSGEVYGQPDAAMSDFVEDYCGPLDLSSPRSCYPEGKRAAEVLCQSYINQHGADAVIVRPCHLFGPTMARRDSRAASEFLWRAVDGQDIVMKSEGLQERSHCYVIDAVQGLFLALLRGTCGKVYNIADPQYQMRIRDFAQLAAKAGGCQIVYEAPRELERRGYSRVSRAVLNSDRLRELGWRGRTPEAIQETVSILKANA